MPVLTVEGFYREGKIELAETPDGAREARVLVTFLPAADREENASAEERRAAAQRMFERMERGISFGGEKFNRDESYEERMRELDERRARKR
ncbi:MAG: hypothetical protein HY321_10580 [Armatimonadetes bacterium]|nr:hypothetical protein [Armatimonadota bacterium]